MADLTGRQSSTAIDHLSRGFERLTQLLALLSSSPAKSTTTSPAIVLVENAMRCIATALSVLQTGDEDGRKGSDSRKRNKGRMESWRIVTSVPHFDGHQWRKYGQKRIHSSVFPRSYYKCTHNKDQGCQATKTIQRKEDNNSNPPQFVVSYSMHHTCKAKETQEIPFVMDSLANTNEHSTYISQAASPDHSLALDLQVEDFEPESLMDSMLSPPNELNGETNWFDGDSMMSPLPAFEFDWNYQMS
ncbi:probable WRKY transcription factor 70 [Phalaenopsis equestris]|uniref:probable WRKY transcription factor 70 n=1 Tax=Phalaenopsis equestris TaxID=78828 RepID=UPI0009E423D6|nr:probable WRKY transcription factor 70 [Phalaenopsis equestris]